MPSGSVVDIRIESHSYDTEDGQRIPVLGDIAFSLVHGSISCLVGPSGCGKTTLLRILLGLENRYRGSVVQHHDHTVAAVFQEPTLLPWRTVDQNLRLILGEREPILPFREMYELLGLTEVTDLYPKELSLGLARRVAFARALSISPTLLLLDEPFTSLDARTAQQLQTVLLGTIEQLGTTVVMVTHDLAEAYMIANRVIVLGKKPAKVLSDIVVDVPRADRLPADADKWARDHA